MRQALAWDWLMAHYEAVRRYCLAHVDVQTAEDVAHDALLRARLGAPPGAVHKPRAYLLRVARNALIDFQRRERARPHVGMDGLAEALPARTTPEPPLVLERVERLARVREAMQRLPPVCRAVFILHRFGGLSQPAIAARLGIATSTVEKHIMRALSSCRAALDER